MKKMRSLAAKPKADPISALFDSEAGYGEWNKILEIVAKTLPQYVIKNYTVKKTADSSTEVNLVFTTKNTPIMKFVTNGKGFRMLQVLGGEELGSHAEERAFMSALYKAFPGIVFDVE